MSAKGNAEAYFRKHCSSEKWQSYIEETRNPTGMEWDAAKLVIEAYEAAYLQGQADLIAKAEASKPKDRVSGDDVTITFRELKKLAEVKK